MSAPRVVVLVHRALAAPDGRGAPGLVGSCDDAALRAAVAIGGGAVTALSAGPAHREDEVLRLALGAGAHRAARVYDPSLEGIDYHGLARVLAAALRFLGYDLILVGDRSAGEGQGALGPAVAELLGVTHISAALDVRRSDAGVLVERRDAGQLRLLRVALPALVTVTRSPAPPHRTPRVAAERAPEIQALDLQALGLQAPELRHRAAAFGRAAPVRPAVTLFSFPDELIARLREERLL